MRVAILAAAMAFAPQIAAQAAPYDDGQVYVADLATGAGLTLMSPAQGNQVVAMAFNGTATTAPAPYNWSVTASYSGVNLGAPPKQMCAGFSFTPAPNNNGSAVLIANKGGLDTVKQITLAGALHIIWTPMNAQVTSFDNGVYTNYAVIPYTAPLIKDGVTPYYGCIRVMPNDVVLTLPDGRVVPLHIPGIAAHAGPFGQFESFTNAVDGPRTTFRGVWFER